jgi:hypothetical protein
VRLVARQQRRELGVVGRSPAGAQHRLADEVRHALAHQVAHGHRVQRRVPEVGEEPVHRRREVVHGVEQRAVEVEGDRVDVEDRRVAHAALPGAATPASSARIRAIVAL